MQTFTLFSPKPRGLHLTSWVYGVLVLKGLVLSRRRQKDSGQGREGRGPGGTHSPAREVTDGIREQESPMSGRGHRACHSLRTSTCVEEESRGGGLKPAPQGDSCRRSEWP